jgi:hypothetical protein
MPKPPIRRDVTRTLGAFALSALALLAIVVIVFAATPARVAASSDRIDLGEVVIGHKVASEVVLVNRHLIRAAHIDEVFVTCPCAKIVGHGAQTVEPRGRITVPLEIELAPRQPSADLRLVLRSGVREPEVVQITARAVLPFEGWPEMAKTSVEDSGLVIQIHPAYARRILDAHCFAPDGRSWEARVDSVGSRLVIDSEAIMSVGAARLHLAVAFQTTESDGTPNWSGPLVINGGSSSTVQPVHRQGAAPGERIAKHERSEL